MADLLKAQHEVDRLVAKLRLWSLAHSFIPLHRIYHFLWWPPLLTIGVALVCSKRGAKTPGVDGVQKKSLLVEGIDRTTHSRAERGFQRLTDAQVSLIAKALGVTSVEYRTALELAWNAPTSIKPSGRGGS